MDTSNQSRILIVDDDPKICALMDSELSCCGYQCHYTTDTDEAQQLLQDHPYDVLVTDVRLPKISGLELLTHARRIRPQCKVILVTGFPERELIGQALLLGAYDYLEKPFRPSDLVAAVSNAVSADGQLPQLHARAAGALEMSDQARQASLQSVQALARAVEAKDPYTRKHSEHVAHYAVHVARLLRLPEDTVESIRVASLLHDIGKIGVPDHILTKPGPLSPEERRIIQRHPDLGAEILSTLTVFRREAKWVRHHHECWDGSGYPDGLSKQQIPLASRIMNAADSLDAMLMARTYKAAMSVEIVIDEIRRCAGTQFDPDVAAVVIRFCQTTPEKLILSAEKAFNASAASA